MDNLLTVKDMAKVLQKSETAVLNLRYRGVLPTGIKIGKTVYFCESDIKKMLEEKREGKNKFKR